MSRILVIGGGLWQCPIVKKAKELGHYVICTNLYENSPAFEFADECRVADILDKKTNLSIAKEFEVDAVLTDQTDLAVPTVAFVAEQLGLKTIGAKVAKRFTNKFEMREFSSMIGIKMPDYKLCYTAEDAVKFLKNNPISIIKPVDSQSSRGIFKVSCEADIFKYFEECISYSNSQKAFLIETYIDGPEFTIDGIKTPLEYITTAISYKEHYKNNPNVAKRLLFSNFNDDYDYDELREVNSQLVNLMELPFGLTHSEFKYKDGEFYLIETAARGGGTKISSDITNLMSGIDSNKILLNILNDEPYSLNKGKVYNYSELGFLEFKPGKVVEISGLEDAAKQEGVYDLRLELNVGDELQPVADDRSRSGYYIIYTDSLDELEQKRNNIQNTVKVVTV